MHVTGYGWCFRVTPRPAFPAYVRQDCRPVGAGAEVIGAEQRFATAHNDMFESPSLYEVGTHVK